ncbi:hypothetical protein [Peribacillus kribbensis]|nr:hypothetical protein [Peribacillus kribbensis]
MPYSPRMRKKIIAYSYIFKALGIISEEEYNNVFQHYSSQKFTDDK